MSGPGNSDFRTSFFEECDELLELAQDGLDALTENPSDQEALNGVFRAVHSIKGGAGAFGLDAMVAFTHVFENALDAIRSGQVSLDEALLDLFRSCGDNLSDLVGHARAGDVDDTVSSPGLIERLSDVTPAANESSLPPSFEPVMLDIGLEPPLEGSGASEEGALPSLETLATVTSEHSATLSGTPRQYIILFSAAPGLFASGNEPFVLFKALSRLGNLTATAQTENVPPLTELNPTICEIDWHLSFTSEAEVFAIRDVFDFVQDVCTIDIRTGQLEVAEQCHSNVDEGEAANTPEKTKQSSTDVGTRPMSQDQNKFLSPASSKTTGSKTTARSSHPDKRKDTIRVDLERIDRLINLVGELVIKEAMLSQAVETLNAPRASSMSTALESLKQIASEIQDGVMAIRAQPVKPLFQRMARTAREASAATGKPVRFVTIGEYTEVDKTVIERLVDPLTHMLRNAIDHGLENTEDRAKVGKPKEGTITLTAAHRSGRVLIDVGDDGAGINREKVRALAVSRGLISEQDTLSPVDVDNLLFMPGFSSKTEVSELSGRGVGLDVVRSEIQKLGGRVTIQSEPGVGTTFSISLPLTLAVLEGLVVQVAQETMVVPISSVQETIRPVDADLDQMGRTSMVLRSRGELIPVFDLGAFFGFRASPDNLADHVLLLISSDQGPRYALVVDAIHDQRQVVIKSLETNYQQVNGVAAATILGDGRIALIIDADMIVRELGVEPALGHPTELAG
jgi:two-component system chemotaxis sensor kinase CheA